MPIEIIESYTYTDALAAIRKAQALTAQTGKEWKATQPFVGINLFKIVRA